MKGVRRDIPYAVLFTQSKVVAKSRTARFVAKQFRDNPRIETFQTEIHERDAFAALYAAGGGVRDLNPKEVNNLPSAIENVSAFAAEVIERLRANQANQAEVA